MNEATQEVTLSDIVNIPFHCLRKTGDNMRTVNPSQEDDQKLIANIRATGAVLQNLVVNAIKFRGEQTPQLCISCIRESDGFRIDVEDNGVGIPPEHTDRVFEIFRRLNARSGEDGTGIGLAVCRRLVELHRGTIRCEPRAAGGTRFTFTISDALAPAAEPRPEAVA